MKFVTKVLGEQAQVLMKAPNTTQEIQETITGKLKLLRRYRCLMFFLDMFMPYLVDVYNSLWTTNNIPDKFTIGIAVLIPKYNGLCTQEYMRLITLFNCDQKLFMKILTNRLKLVAKHVLNEYQSGYPGSNPLYFIILQIREALQY